MFQSILKVVCKWPNANIYISYEISLETACIQQF